MIEKKFNQSTLDKTCFEFFLVLFLLTSQHIDTIRL